MRTTARLFTGTALAATTLGLSLVACAAHAGERGELDLYPSVSAPGATVTVNTTACGRNGHGKGDARSLGAGEFRLRPGDYKDIAVGQFRVPEKTRAGTYEIFAHCENGGRARGDLTVEHRREHHGRHERQPSGHVRTGVGGSVGPDTTRIAAGAAVLAAAAVGGTWLLRRRASGAQDS
ncbi:hypothetical protein OG875_22005 [Streptomyces sp. NBC_01498]|uniref:hypothetical protein n=1 Tax=Streptomyces sp. NBC_01498 TaxID=2975870 RepID=UPI002E7C1D27|nr:hypothetical protein [Streptomyces sp. NBC_01498]WTL27003.1 hypothetical protein OG875_22005 [Streptomyces sp. NBC_01498]